MVDVDGDAVVQQGMGEKQTTTLWRPVGQAELNLIIETESRRFPPRLPEQPIFYPVCNEPYACEISEKWNTRDQCVGYVTRFEVSTDFLATYQTEVVGARHHEEYWIPAEELDVLGITSTPSRWPKSPACAATPLRGISSEYLSILRRFVTHADRFVLTETVHYLRLRHLDAFNDAIVGKIEVVRTFTGGSGD